MKMHADTHFRKLFDHGGRLTLECMSFERCSFFHCLLSITKDISLRSVVRDVHLKDCEAIGCDIGPAILEDCSVDGLKTDDLLIIWGGLFKHVTLSGQIGEIKINTMVSPFHRGPETQQPFDGFREQYYATLDWAFDIRNARFKNFDVDGIPARLFRLDLETQAVVTRERALQPEWQERVSPWNKLWLAMIRDFIKVGDADMVLVTPMGEPKAERDELLKGLKELRKLGVAEPI